MEALLSSDSTQVDVARLGNVARELGECVEEIGCVKNSFHSGGQMTHAFGKSAEGSQAFAEYQTMHDSLHHMVTSLHNLGTRHQEALTSAAAHYQRTDTDSARRILREGE